MSETLKSLRFTLLAVIAALFVSAFIIVITDIEALGDGNFGQAFSTLGTACLLYTSPSPRDGLLSRMPSSA